MASGGGTADRHIRILNVNTGSNLSSLDAKSQVWIKNEKKIKLLLMQFEWNFTGLISTSSAGVFGWIVLAKL
jgi:hypothetical protein